MNDERELKNKILLKEIDQLENATTEFSNSTRWMKKACFSIITVVLPLLIKGNISLSGLEISSIIFLIAFIFWIVDSYCYYYQVKLRWMMGMKFRELDSKWPYNNGKTPRKASRIQALFNNSHVLYYILLIPLFIPAILEIVNLACASCKTK